MAYRWPLLKIYGVPSIPKLVDRCLAELDGLTLEEQFAARGVVSIYGLPLEQGSHLDDSHSILRALVDTRTPLHVARLGQIVAREIALTFSADNRIELLRRHDQRYKDATQRFMDLFAERWISAGHNWLSLEQFAESHIEGSAEECFCVHLVTMH